jgi:hypothetical protein
MKIKRLMTKGIKGINVAALIVAGATASSIAFACVNITQPTCPANPPNKTGCANANAPTDNYEALVCTASGYQKAVNSGCQCTYDCPGDNPNDPTCWGPLYTLTGTCPKGSAPAIRGVVPNNAIPANNNGGCGGG